MRRRRVGDGRRAEHMISLSVIVIGSISCVWRRTNPEKVGPTVRDLSPLTAPANGTDGLARSHRSE